MMPIETSSSEPQPEQVEPIEASADTPPPADDLLSELTQAINEVPEAPELDDPEEIDPGPGTAELGDDPGEEEDDGSEDMEPPKSMNWKAIAGGMINFVDKVQTWIGKKVGKARLLSKFEEEEIKTVEAVKDKTLPKNKLNGDQLEVMQRWMESEEKFQLLDDVLPLSAEEKSMIEEPLQACLEKWKTNLTPETMLIIALVMVLSPRALHVVDI